MVCDIIITICNVVIAAGAVVGIFNYIKSENRKKIESACVLSKYYKDKVLNNIVAVCELYKMLGIGEAVKKIDISKMNKFDEEELNLLYDSNLQNKINGISSNQEFISSVLTIADIYGLKFNGTKYDDANKKVEVRPELLKMSVYDLISDVLNSLEYFAMNFITNAADEEVVYPSLSQTYLEVIKYLYYYIAKENKRVSSKKYFTNVIDLFKIWRDKYLEDEEKSKNIDLTHRHKKI